LHLKGYIFIVA